jgi:hypothetical protein
VDDNPRRVFVKVLANDAVFCQTDGCSRRAEFLFRGEGRVWAQCPTHALTTAARRRVELPQRAVLLFVRHKSNLTSCSKSPERISFARIPSGIATQVDPMRALHEE